LSWANGSLSGKWTSEETKDPMPNQASEGSSTRGGSRTFNAIVRARKDDMKKGIAIVGVAAIGVVLFILSLIPAEVVISREASGPSESYMLKGLARSVALATGLFAFASGLFVAGLWSRWGGK
jgi:hypothetical protein